MDDTDEDISFPREILRHAKDILLAPVRIALSPALLRAYLRTVLVLITSSILFGIAVLAYSTFYYTYIPIRGISVPVYLQFDATYAPSLTKLGDANPRNEYPFGVANVKGLVSRQKYDVMVEMVLPRSERNLEAGNWMVGVEMRGPGAVESGIRQTLRFGEEWDVGDWSQDGGVGSGKETVTPLDKAVPTATTGGVLREKPNILARSRRPAILTYRSWMTEFAYRVLRLPLYVVGWGQEAEKVEIQIIEGIEFEKGWRNVPASLRLEVSSKTPLEVYDVVVRFIARLGGLRWAMYHYKLTSAFVFTSLFWVVEMTVVLMTWGIFTILFGGEHYSKDEGKRKKIKTEDSGALTPKSEAASSAPSTPLSDVSRTFPTLSSQQPLYYATSSSDMSKMKEERVTPNLEDIPAKTEAEADIEDEDEDADFILEEPVPNSAVGGFTDSGVGTSLESSRDGEGGRGLVRRRSGRKDRER